MTTISPVKPHADLGGEETLAASASLSASASLGAPEEGGANACVRAREWGAYAEELLRDVADVEAGRLHVDFPNLRLPDAKIPANAFMQRKAIRRIEIAMRVRLTFGDVRPIILTGGFLAELVGLGRHRERYGRTMLTSLLDNDVLRLDGTYESHQPGSDYRVFQPGDRDLADIWADDSAAHHLAGVDRVDKRVQIFVEPPTVEPGAVVENHADVDDADVVRAVSAVGMVAAGDSAGREFGTTAGGGQVVSPDVRHTSKSTKTVGYIQGGVEEFPSPEPMEEPDAAEIATPEQEAELERIRGKYGEAA